MTLVSNYNELILT